MASLSSVRKFLFHLTQPVFGGLGRFPAHNHAQDISVLVGDVPLDVGYLPICLEDVIAVGLGHDRKMRPGA
jgi:hypothetical protein